jgi:hypothetical protein
MDIDKLNGALVANQGEKHGRAPRKDNWSGSKAGTGKSFFFQHLFKAVW